MGRFGVAEIIVISSSCFNFFGGKKIPELMKGLGSRLKNLKYVESTSVLG
jgi:Sec-independent protein translocase protein TatA